MSFSFEEQCPADDRACDHQEAQHGQRLGRGLHGEEVEPFEARLMEGSQWAIRSIDDSTKEKVKRLLDEGYQQKDIAEELGITKGRVSQLAKQIKNGV